MSVTLSSPSDTDLCTMQLCPTSYCLLMHAYQRPFGACGNADGSDVRFVLTNSRTDSTDAVPKLYHELSLMGLYKDVFDFRSSGDAFALLKHHEVE